MLLFVLCCSCCAIFALCCSFVMFPFVMILVILFASLFQFGVLFVVRCAYFLFVVLFVVCGYVLSYFRLRVVCRMLFVVRRVWFVAVCCL